MHILKLNLRLVVILAALAGVIFAFGTIAPPSTQRASAVSVIDIDGVSCSDLWLTRLQEPSATVDRPEPFEPPLDEGIQNTGLGHIAISLSLTDHDTTSATKSSEDPVTTRSVAYNLEIPGILDGDLEEVPLCATLKTPAVATALANSSAVTSTTLSQDIDDSQTTIPLASTAGFATRGVVLFESEEASYTGVNTTSETSVSDCANDEDDDGDGIVNDGCPVEVDAEAGDQCLDAVDSDNDGLVNDGCKAFTGLTGADRTNGVVHSSGATVEFLSAVTVDVTQNLAHPPLPGMIVFWDSADPLERGFWIIDNDGVNKTPDPDQIAMTRTLQGLCNNEPVAEDGSLYACEPTNKAVVPVDCEGVACEGDGNPDYQDIDLNARDADPTGVFHQTEGEGFVKTVETDLHLVEGNISCTLSATTAEWSRTQINTVARDDDNDQTPSFGTLEISSPVDAPTIEDPPGDDCANNSETEESWTALVTWERDLATGDYDKDECTDAQELSIDPGLSLGDPFNPNDCKPDSAGNLSGVYDAIVPAFTPDGDEGAGAGSCSDGLDNDNDGFTDSADSACANDANAIFNCIIRIDHALTDPAADEVKAAASCNVDIPFVTFLNEGAGTIACTDGLDNDEDGFIDSLDTDCPANPLVQTGDALPGPLPPPPYTTSEPTKLSGSYDSGTDTLTLNGCFRNTVGNLTPNTVIEVEIGTAKAQLAADGLLEGRVTIWGQVGLDECAAGVVGPERLGLPCAVCNPVVQLEDGGGAGSCYDGDDNGPLDNGAGTDGADLADSDPIPFGDCNDPGILNIHLYSAAKVDDADGEDGAGPGTCDDNIDNGDSDGIDEADDTGDCNGAPWRIGNNDGSVLLPGQTYGGGFTTSPATDFDGDGCTDADELSKFKVKCGDDPYNPNDSDSDSTGPISILAENIPADKVNGELVGGTYFYCLGYTEHTVTETPTDDLEDVTTTTVCYQDSPLLSSVGGSAIPGIGRGLPGAPPPPGFGLNVPIVNTGKFDPATNLISTIGCFEDVGGALGPNIITQAITEIHTGVGTVDIFAGQTNADCEATPPTPQGDPFLTTSLLVAPQSDNTTTGDHAVDALDTSDDWDSDGDGCSDSDEVLGTGTKCGDDPFNPYDSDTNVNSSLSLQVAFTEADIQKEGTAAESVCTGDVDEDGDLYINDGCPFEGTGIGPESGAECKDILDNDGDGFVNDGCPQVKTSSEFAIQCGDGITLNTADEDGDNFVNDGCIERPTSAQASEADADCENDSDDDSDGFINDGCPEQASIPGEYLQCTAAVTQDTNALTAPIYCYLNTGDKTVNPVASSEDFCEPFGPAPKSECGPGEPGAPPPLPFGDIDDFHNVLSGTYNKGTNEVNIKGCLKSWEGDWGGVEENLYVDFTFDGQLGQGSADVYPNTTSRTDAECEAGANLGTAEVGVLLVAEQKSTEGLAIAHHYDTDHDGCSNAQELQFGQGAPNNGGLRDPYNYWDFMDVYTGDPPAKSRNVGGPDIAATVLRFGATDAGDGDFDRGSNPLDPPEVALSPSNLRANYHPAFDRSGGITGSNTFNNNPPNGNVGGPDIAAVVLQFGHTCRP